ncbi:MAG TPA: hypothetical protein VMZ25_01275 [Terriglobales bacterium]|nr:hypothetical protein [Terriglobales bacterium]
MLSKCANPDCTTPLHYLREGKVFRVEKDGPVLVAGKKPASSVEHFWLCGPCSERSTLLYDAKNGVRLASKSVALVRRAAAS